MSKHLTNPRWRCPPSAPPQPRAGAGARGPRDPLLATPMIVVYTELIHFVAAN